MEEIQNQIETISKQFVNKGTGAGGKNTNILGKKFEDDTNNENRLIESGFTKIFYMNKKQKSRQSDYYLCKKYEYYDITFVLQGGLKQYMKKTYNIDLFRHPDEAYIIRYNNDNKKCIVKILEKKEQSVAGSVETKLWASLALKREYEIILGNDFVVEYGLCVSKYLENLFLSSDKKYSTLTQILRENNIDVLFGQEEEYFAKLDKWISNSL